MRKRNPPGPKAPLIPQRLQLKWLVNSIGSRDILPAVPEHGLRTPGSKLNVWFGEKPSLIGANGFIYQIAAPAYFQAEMPEVYDWLSQDWNLLLRTDRVRALTIDSPSAHIQAIDEIVQLHLGKLPKVMRGEGCVTYFMRIIGVADFLSKQMALSPADRQLKVELWKVRREKPFIRPRSITLHGRGDIVQFAGQTKRGGSLRYEVDIDAVDIPTVTTTRLEALWAQLSEAGRMRAPLFEAWENVALFAAENCQDPFIQWLIKSHSKAHNKIVRVDPDGALRVTCPIHRNINRPTCDYLKIYPGHFDEPTRIVCGHKGCAGRSVEDFHRLLKYPGANKAQQAELIAASADPLSRLNTPIGDKRSTDAPASPKAALPPSSTARYANPVVGELIERYGFHL